MRPIGRKEGGKIAQRGRSLISTIASLSTHADRQSVDISFIVCLCTDTNTNFSSEDKASGVKFCTVVQGRPGQEIFYLGEPSFSRNPKSDELARARRLIDASPLN